MSYVFETNVQDLNTDTALGVRFTNRNGIFQSVYTVQEQVKENLKTLLLTRIGERYMQPEFGTDLLSVIFEPNVNELKEDIQNILTAPISLWLPYLRIEQLDIVTAEDDPTMTHTVEISLTYTVQNFSTDTIKIFVSDETLSVA